MIEVETLQAGRETDALVAEQVMGWSDVQADAYTPYGQDVCGTVPGATDLTWNVGRKAVPRYSTIMADAWLIVEKLRDEWTTATENVSGVDDSFLRPFDDAVFFGHLHRSADRRWPWAFFYVTPLEICRAALKATLQADTGGEDTK